VFVDAERNPRPCGAIVHKLDGGFHHVTGKKGNMKIEVSKVRKLPVLSSKEM
jgi:hypothetical protein